MMQKGLFIVVFFLLFIKASGQVNTDSIKKEIVLDENDTLLNKTVLLQEVIVYNKKLSLEERKQFLILQNRVLKVYPYAKTASERLSALNVNMDKLTTSRDKKKYFKIVEDYLDSEFKDRLKKLSRKQGQILVKLIYRQTGFTTYDLIKDYKTGWKAFWSNNTARLFDINLKTAYDPYKVNEDYLIETILNRAFSNGRLVEQSAANPVDIEKLNNFWINKSIELDKKNTK